MAILAPVPTDESERLAALLELDILDTMPETDYDDLAILAAHVCGTPVSTITLVDTNRQWYKAAVGASAGFESRRDESFCAHAILGPDLFVVEDAAEDERFTDNPHVTKNLKIRFYAGAPLKSSTGSGLGTLCVIDTVPHVLTPQQRTCLQALGRQVERLLDLRRISKQLERSLDAKSEFLRIASHDLKSPLTVILGGISVLRDHMETSAGGAIDLPTARVLADSVDRQARKMHRLIGDYLDAQALDDGRMKMDFQQEHISIIVAEVANDLAIYASGKDSDIVLNLSPNLPEVRCDAPRLTQVVMNFISNALKFSPAGSRITVRARAAYHLPESIYQPAEDANEFDPESSSPGNGASETTHQSNGTEDAQRQDTGKTAVSDSRYIVVEVSDEGPGISDEDRPRLFAQYGKLTARPTGGESSTGLGLDICQKLIRMQGGHIGIYNNPTIGATFWFALPVSPAQKAQ